MPTELLMWKGQNILSKQQLLWLLLFTGLSICVLILFKGLEDIILTGAARILTSGQKNTVPEGADLIRRLIEQAGDRIIIMPGSGLNESNIAEMARVTGAKEFHLTGRKVVESAMQFRREGIPMGGFPDIPEFSRKVADTDRIAEIIKILKMV